MPLFLKRIELRGFKSFADNVEIEFQRGINAIVGPNGSGKSNIVDAIRWVLGEQSMRSLRSAKLGDVIFNGSNLKKPVGMAEVSITLDNSDNLLPIDFSEVYFTRRVFRSGESEFYLNKTPCRLKDIQEILMDTGIGKDGYSVIGQGNIDEMLTCRPEERRFIFEETAGIMKYRMRKREAEKRLEETMANITRIDDILGEIHNQLVPLALQKEKALEHQRLSRQCRELDVNLHLLELTKREKESLRIKKSMGEAEVKLHVAMEDIEHLQEKVSSDKRELEIKEIEQEAAQKEFFAIDGNIKDIEKDMRWTQEEIVRLRGESESLEKSMNELKIKIHMDTDDLNQSISKMEQELKAINGLETQIGLEEKGLFDLDDAIDKKELIIEGLKGDVIDLLNFVAQKRNNITSLKTMRSNLESRKKQIDRELLQLYEINNKTQGEIENITDEVKELRNSTSEHDESLKQLTQCLVEERKLYEENEKLQNEVWQELSSVISKQRALEEIRDSFEGYQYGVKNLLSSIKNKRFICPGIYGTVADLISVGKDHEVAIETALGGALQNIICDSEIEAKAAIEFLKKNNFGRVTFLPLATLKNRSLDRNIKHVLTLKGCVGSADGLVSYDSKYSNAIIHLLGRVLVADTMDNAIDLARGSGFSLKVVTLDGQVLNPGGSITGGSQRRPNLILTRKRQLMEYHQREEELKKELSMAQEVSLSLKAGIDEKQSLIEGHRNKLFEIKPKVSALEKQLQEKQSLMEERQYRKNQLKKEKALIAKEAQEAETDILAIESEIGDIDHKSLDSQSRAKSLQIELSQDRAKREEKAQQITQLKIESASKQQEYIGIKHAIQRCQSNIDEGTSNLKTFEEKHMEYLRERQRMETSIQRHVDKAGDLKILHRELQDRVELLKGERENLKRQIEDCQNQIQQVSQEQKRLEKQLQDTRVSDATLEVEIKQVKDRLFETYSLRVEDALAFKAEVGQPDEIKHRLEIYRSQMASLGPVNPQAIENYNNLKERCDFLEAQRLDMVCAKENLDQLIDDMAKIMEEVFLESFNIVKAEFSKIFNELFGGGTADLTIVGEGSILESGIEITAQPPGKRLQSLSLLSGGERALTAIALLFAILNTKATPFCILDEIEATLDDANIDRFTKYLKKVSKHTQFIVVTHRKTTMEVADALYGISMEDTAISKVLSVKMET